MAIFGIIGILLGLCGGWGFCLIKLQLPKSWHTYFDLFSILMLLQDICVAVWRMGVSYDSLYFAVAISASPAVGFLAAKQGIATKLTDE